MIAARFRIVAELLLALVLALGANYLAARHYRRSDFTRGQTFTLSPKTGQLLHSLSQPVEAIVFMLPSGEDANDLYADVRELFVRAGHLTDRLHVEYVDIDREPDRLKTV